MDVQDELRAELAKQAERDLSFGALLASVRATPSTPWGVREAHRICDEWLAQQDEAQRIRGSGRSLVRSAPVPGSGGVRVVVDGIDTPSPAPTSVAA